MSRRMEAENGAPMDLATPPGSGAGFMLPPPSFLVEMPVPVPVPVSQGVAAQEAAETGEVIHLAQEVPEDLDDAGDGDDVDPESEAVSASEAGDVSDDEASTGQAAPITSSEEVERLRLRDLENIRTLVQQGRPLNEAQIRRLEAAAGGAAAAATGAGTAVWVANQTMLAEALGLESRKTIQRWMAREGCPGTAADGRYNVTAWKAWMLEHGLGRTRKGTDLEEIKNRQALLQLRMQQIELDELEGRCLPVDETVSVLCDLMTRLNQGLRSLKHSLAPAVVGETVAEASKRIGAAVDEVMNQIALPEQAKKKAFWQTVSAMLSAHLRRLLHTSLPASTSGSTTATDGTPT